MPSVHALGKWVLLTEGLAGPKHPCSMEGIVERLQGSMHHVEDLQPGLDGGLLTTERLMTQWPRCWGLVYLADDSARAERLEKTRRRVTIEAAQGRQTPRDWDPSRPWSCIFIMLAGDMEFWAERVHHPAAAWVASGGRGAPTVASEAAVLEAMRAETKLLQAIMKLPKEAKSPKGPKPIETDVRQNARDRLQKRKSWRGTGLRRQVQTRDIRRPRARAKASPGISRDWKFATAGQPERGIAKVFHLVESAKGQQSGSTNVDSAYHLHIGMLTAKQADLEDRGLENKGSQKPPPFC